MTPRPGQSSSGPKMTPTDRVLEFLRRQPMEPHYVLDIMEATGLRSGRVYPALARLERGGFIASDWQDRSNLRRRVYWAQERS